MTVDILCTAFREMWGAESPRSRTLARLVNHERQIEAWWKCEIVAHMWEYLDRFGDNVYVWLESFDRADIAIATGAIDDNGRVVPATHNDRIIIPIELKMIGTFWGRSNVEKAYRESGKKRLEHDMIDASSGRRTSQPCSAVALLVTHAGAPGDSVFELYLRRARELGEQHGLVCTLDEAIPLPTILDEPSAAHHFLWTTISP